MRNCPQPALISNALQKQRVTPNLQVMIVKNVLFLFTLLSTVRSLPVANENASPALVERAAVRPQLGFTMIHEFPLGTWVENGVVRKTDGNILVTLLSSPDLYLVSTSNDFKPIHVHHFPGSTGLAGIAEYSLDVFYVVTGNWSTKSFTSTPGSWSVWEVDMRKGAPQDAKVSKIADFPDSGFLNGIEVLNPVEGLLLIADTLYGLVWSVNVNTGAIGVVVNDTSMHVLAGDPFKLGVNGIHLLDDQLYYTVSDKNTFSKIPLDLKTGHPTGPAVTLVETPVIYGDDFTLDFEGNAWVACDPYNEIAFLPGVIYEGPNETTSKVQIAAGHLTATHFAGLTSVHVGTKQADIERGSLYVTTTGGFLQYVGRNWTTGGSVVRLDTATYLK